MGEPEPRGTSGGKDDWGTCGFGEPDELFLEHRVGLVGFTLGPVLVGVRLVLAVLSTLEAPHEQTLVVEAGACFGALVGGWGLARLTAVGGARVWGEGGGRLLGAMGGVSVGSFGGDLLIRHGSGIIMGLAFGGGLWL